jgi:hypothetical protein
MRRNTPNVGPDDDAQQELTTSQRRALRAGLANIAARTREFLPDEYVVGSEIASGRAGVRATVAVHPPAGNPVSAGFEPDFSTDEDAPISAADREEVARGLAASAALQVKQAVGDDVEQTAR